MPVPLLTASTLDTRSFTVAGSLDPELNEDQDAEQYARHYLLPLFDPPSGTPLPVDPRIGETLPSQWCWTNMVAPLSDDGKTLEIAITEPDRLLLADEVRRLTGRQMRPLFATKSVVIRLLNSLYDKQLQPDAPVKTDDPAAPNQAAASVLNPELNPELNPAQPSTISILGGILRLLVQGRVEQILIQPWENRVQIRARHASGCCELETIDRQECEHIYKQIQSQIGSEDQSLSDFAVSGHAGKLEVRYGQKRVALNVSCCPTIGGVAIALNRAKTHRPPKHLRETGLQSDQWQLLTRLLKRRSGLIVLAGSRGSGKTTTLYAALSDRKEPAVHICTVEDNATCDLSGITQASLAELAGLSKVDAIELVVAQMPDLIAIDQLNDAESARVAIREAAQGRLVIVTVDSDNAASAVVRLEQLGISRSQQAGLLVAIVAQQREGRLCHHCRRSSPITVNAASLLGVSERSTLSWPAGCSACGNRGYQGSVAAFEVIEVDDAVAQVIRADGSHSAFYNAARENGAIRIFDVLTSHALAGSVHIQFAGLS